MRAGWIVLFALVHACGPKPEPGPDVCEGQVLVPGTRCRCDAACPETEDGKRFCDPVSRDCVLETRECANTFDCCPGQVCNRGVFCVDRGAQCEGDAACVLPGQKCRAFGSGQVTDKACVLDVCGAGGTCAEGLSCFDGVCVGVNPCEGGCPANQVCVPLTNACFDVGTGTEPFNRWAASCRVSCAEGSMLVFAAPTNLFNRCNRALTGCVCLPKPF